MRVIQKIIITALAFSPALGDDAVRLTFDAGDDWNASWSPNGTTIAFSSTRSGTRDIYTIPATGGSPTRLTSHSSAEVYPEWSPDGLIILYYRSAGDELYKIPSTGGTATRFTYNDYFDIGPTWSSDDTRIAFHGHYSKAGSNLNQSDNMIFWIPADDGTANPNLIISGWNNRVPDWCPDDSNVITFSRDPGDGIEQIWIMTVGGSAYRVTDDTYDNFKSSWSPGGQYLAYGSDRSGNWDIWIIPAAGGTPLQVTDDPALDRNPTWSPDGEKIAFHSVRAGSYDIYVIDVSGLVNIESASLGEIKAHYATDEMKGK